jgi:hypothetical protein
MRLRLICHSSSNASSQTQIAGASGYSCKAGLWGLKQSPCTQITGLFINTIKTINLQLTEIYLENSDQGLGNRKKFSYLVRVSAFMNNHLENKKLSTAIRY